MTMTDPIADMLTRIRNASKARHESVDIPASRLKQEVARILKEEGYTRDYTVATENGFPVIRVFLKYSTDKQPAITGIRRISKPGLRVYAKKTELPRVFGGLGIAILSTPKGIMTNNQAKKEEVGGEVMAYVW
ncbi:MAG: 30S ribosomal protein S8 [Actinobacteria bacterium]|nr:30S ribosomal protein S8 [Actinomycetota bacterium]